MGLWSKIKGAISRMFPKENIEKALNIKIAVSPEMQAAQKLWRDMFFGNAPWNNDKIKSKRTAAAIAAEFARVCTVEFVSKITGSARADFLDEQYQLFIKNTKFQITASKLNSGGELILKPTITATGKIRINVIENNCYYPIAYNSDDELIEYVSVERIERENKFYTLLEWNKYDETKRIFTFDYFAFQSNSEDVLGISIPLTSVPEWEKYKEHDGFSNVSAWFVHIKTPFQNTVEQSNRNGISVYAKAVDIIRQIDELGELADHEFKAGRLRQQVSIEALKKSNSFVDENSQMYNKIDYDIFLALDTGENDINKLITTYNPAHRNQSYSERKDELFREGEFLCQMSYGILSDPANVDRTATEVRASKERFFSANTSFQSTWQDAQEKLINIMDEQATAYSLAPKGEYETSFSWGDSILADRVTEFQERIQAQDAGWLSPIENRAWYNSTSEEEAAKTMPGVLEEVE